MDFSRFLHAKKTSHESCTKKTKKPLAKLPNLCYNAIKLWDSPTKEEINGNEKGNITMSVMQKGILITDPKYNSIPFNHPWAQGLSFTSKDCVLPIRNDVTTFMKPFSPKKKMKFLFYIGIRAKTVENTGSDVII